MLYQSDYWLASSFQEKTETIVQFIDTDEGITTLFILDVDITEDVPAILDNLIDDGDLTCIINLITDSGTSMFSPENTVEDYHIKTIYVRNKIDSASLDLMRNTSPILAIFA